MLQSDQPAIGCLINDVKHVLNIFLLKSQQKNIEIKLKRPENEKREKNGQTVNLYALALAHLTNFSTVKKFQCPATEKIF